MKTKQILIALGALLVLSGCSRTLTPGTETIRLTACTESDTRATIDADSGEFAWETGDAVAVHLSSGYATAALATDGTFVLTVPSGTTRNGYAIYPASAAAGTASAPEVSLPATYSIVGDLQSESVPLPMVAVNDPNRDILYFHHVGGLMQITVTTVPVGTKTVSVTLDKGVTGDFTIADPATLTPTTAPGSSSSTVTFTVSADGLDAAASNLVLNLPVPCGTYTSMTVALSPSGTSKTLTDNMVIGRAQGLKVKVTP